MPKLQLGPIVGHTDWTSTRVWIRVDGGLEGWSLGIDGHPNAPFVPTDPAKNEFGTAIATLDGLEPDTAYEYRVFCDGAPVASGSLRSMLAPGARDEVSFVSLSCNDGKTVGAWPGLAKLVEADRPRFLLMVGDQVYLDAEDDDLWTRHLNSTPEVRRRAIAAKYQEVWSREPARWIMANTPTYMVWDDHDIRDGWGSGAADSPTLAAKYPAGAAIHKKHRAFFDDARDIYYHFQACRNPGGDAVLDGAAAPFSFRCGRLLVVFLDERTERDFARPQNPVLGDAQWDFVRKLVATLDAGVDAIALANGIPLVDLHPEGKTHRMFRDRTDDIEPFSRGDEALFTQRRTTETNKALMALSGVLGTTIDRDFRFARALHVCSADIDDARDRWSYKTNRPEQEQLLRLFAGAATQGRAGLNQRGLVFLGGDIHVGALFDIAFEKEALSAQCLVSSGISQTPPPMVKVREGVVDAKFTVADGITAELSHLVGESNFGVTKIEFHEGSTPTISNGFGHAGADE